MSSSRIDIAIVEYVAKLARLTLSEQEKRTYAEQLDKIIGYFDQLKTLDTTGIEPMSHALPLNNVMRADDVEAFPERESLLAMAPIREGDFFRVPKIGD